MRNGPEVFLSMPHDAKRGNQVLLPLARRPENLYTLKARENLGAHRSTRRHTLPPGGLSRANENAYANDRPRDCGRRQHA